MTKIIKLREEESVQLNNVPVVEALLDSLRDIDQEIDEHLNPNKINSSAK